MSHNFEIKCKYCNEKTKSENDIEKVCCNETCDSKYNDKNIKKSLCLVCNLEFYHYGEQTICSEKCNLKYIASFKLSENIYNSKLVSKNCLTCGKKFDYKKDQNSSEERDYCSLFCSHKLKTMPIENTPANKVCVLCGKEEGCSPFYFNGDKDINLCEFCEDVAIEDVQFWNLAFTALVSCSEIVQKPWGIEVHIANHNEYCLKYLIFLKDRQFSHHMHLMKKELWHCLYGKFECVIEYENEKKHFILNTGNKIEINPTVVHQLQAIENSILLEVSTRHYNEDSYRMVLSRN